MTPLGLPLLLAAPALAPAQDAPGLILDFRGNSGGGFDHDAVLGRFVPEGGELRYAKTHPERRPAPLRRTGGGDRRRHRAQRRRV